MTNVAVFWTIAVAVVAWAVVECCRLSAVHLRLARAAWTLGAIVTVIHAVAAFVVLYQGSQEIALAAVARQTAVLTGVTTGAGLYVNCAFIVVWIADVAWWWMVPPAKGAIVGSWAWARFAFFLFMFINGGVIFADGWMRWLGLLAVIAVIAALIRPGARGRAIAARLV